MVKVAGRSSANLEANIFHESGPFLQRLFCSRCGIETKDLSSLATPQRGKLSVRCRENGDEAYSVLADHPAAALGLFRIAPADGILGDVEENILCNDRGHDFKLEIFGNLYLLTCAKCGIKVRSGFSGHQ